MATRPADSITAPGMSSDAWARWGDGGTMRDTSARPSSPNAVPTTNSQRHDAWSMMRPPIMSPSPPPAPSMAEMSPMATPMRSRGTSSRMMLKHSGYTAPPMPCTARNRISDQMFHAKIDATEPAVKIASVTSSIRSLPCWSPSRPSSGVATAALSR